MEHRKVKIRVELLEELLKILDNARSADTALVASGKAWGLLKAFLDTVPPVDDAPYQEKEERAE